MKIYLHYKDIEYRIEKEGEISEWLINVAKAEGNKIGEIDYILVDDQTIRIINKEFLNHDGFTDVIAFNNTKGKKLYGEIYISIDSVKRNANEYSEGNLNFELMRVLVHGLLHIVGYDDKAFEQKRNMRKLEDKYLNLYLKR